MSAVDRVRLVDIARSQVGTTEYPSGSNRNKYAGEIAPAYQGQPWCAIFVSWAFRHADLELPDVGQGPDFFAYCPFAVNYARAHGQTVPVAEAVEGDVVLFDWGHDGVADHVGVFVGHLLDGHLQTIEGNTAVGNDSNGGAVMERFDRWPSQVAVVWRPPSLLVPDPPPILVEDPLARYAFFPSWSQVHQDGPFVGQRPVVVVDEATGRLRGRSGCTFEPRDLAVPDASGNGEFVVDVSNGPLKGGQVIATIHADGSDEVVFVTEGGQYALTAVKP